MWGIEGARFWCADPTKTTDVYTMNANMVQFRRGIMQPVKGDILPNITLPTRLLMGDAYALVEYISLEEYEALTLRSAELTYHVEQHLAIAMEPTLETKEQRLAIPFTNPTKEIMWVLQNPLAETYNAWFLFTKNLTNITPYKHQPNPCLVPWWPDAQVLPADAWQVVPAFQTVFSEALESAILLYSSYDRFQHDASFFRTIVPSMYYAKPALYNRYIYAYSFGQNAVKKLPNGAANWDKIGNKELYITLKSGSPNLNVYVYVTIWNVFKVYGGRGSMLFSN
jgi:hypothetical protein